MVPLAGRGVGDQVVAARVAVWVAVHRCAVPSEADRSGTLVQLELIRTAVSRAANAVGPPPRLLPLRIEVAGLPSAGAGTSSRPLAGTDS